MSMDKLERLKRKIEEESRKLKQIEAVYNSELRKKMNHAKFIIAGELLKSSDREEILKKLLKDKTYSKRDDECIKTLLSEYKIKL